MNWQINITYVCLNCPERQTHFNILKLHENINM